MMCSYIRSKTYDEVWGEYCMPAGIPKGEFEVTESVSLSCILYATMTGTIKAHKIHIKLLPDLDGQQSYCMYFFGPFADESTSSRNNK